MCGKDLIFADKWPNGDVRAHRNYAQHSDCKTHFQSFAVVLSQLNQRTV